MKLFANYTHIIFTFLFLFGISTAKAANYTTIANGDWNDVTSVWSTDGGLTPCFCTPGINSSGNNITVNHNLTLSSNVNINGGSSFLLNASGNLNGNFDFSSWNATLDFFGTATVKKLMQGINSAMSMHPGSVIMATGQFVVKDQLFSMDGAVINAAGMDVWAGATLNILNSSRVFLTSGNMENYGTIQIGPASCLASNGNWKNHPGGVMTGTGACNSGGNINNQGIWDVNLVWCATGAGIGIPSPENCPGASGICSAITLPVELVSFTAEAVEMDYILVEWETESEINNSHFTLLSSKDGKEWEEIAIIEGAGNSSESIKYSFEDYNVTYGNTYYQLVQTDFDGRETSSDVIGVFIKGSEGELNVYPNPANNGTNITISNIGDGEATIQVLTMSGHVLQSDNINSFTNSHEMTINGLMPGIYFISVEQFGVRKTKRLVVTK